MEIGEHDYGQNPTPGVTDRQSLPGSWTTDDESATAARDGAQPDYRFAECEIFLVMDGPAGVKVRIQVEGGDPPGGADVQGEEVTVPGVHLYRLMRLSETARGTTAILTLDRGVSANAFTFR